MRCFAIACGLAAFASLAGAATSWRYYANDRFGVSADVPANWREEPAPDNDDGRVFDSPDGKAQIVVNGGFVMEDSAALALDALGKPREGERVTYAKRGALSLTLSGLRGEGIFYRRTIVTCSGQVWNNFEIHYPASEKAAYDALVAHAAGSLRGGAPAGMACRS